MVVTVVDKGSKDRNCWSWFCNGETCKVGRHLTGNGLVLLGRLIGEAFVVVVMVSWYL